MHTAHMNESCSHPKCEERWGADKRMSSGGHEVWEITHGEFAARAEHPIITEHKKLRQEAEEWIAFVGDHIVVVGRHHDGLPAIFRSVPACMAYLRDWIVHPATSTGPTGRGYKH